MRSPMMADGSLSARRTAVLAVWLGATLTLATTLRSTLPVVILTGVILAVIGVYRHFDSCVTLLRAVYLRLPGQAKLEGSFAQHFVGKEFAAARRGRKLTLVMFGLTNLEQFREREGAEAAAAALREFGRVLQQMTRQMNLSSRCGWRADAFLAVLTEADAAAAEVFIARVRAAVAASAVPMPRVEAGIAVYQPHLASPEEFVEAAEHALATARAAAGALRQPRHTPPMYGAGMRQLQAG
jgi:diguanylate cyclase (GGDEF)-like protein